MGNLLSYDIKSVYDSGKRTFENSNIDYAQLEGWTLEGVEFRECKFNYSSFRHANVRNSKFIDCELFFVSFFGSNLENALFENCTLNLTRFDSSETNNTIFKKCNISYTLVLNTNLKFENCSKLKVITDVSQVTQEDIRDVLGILAPSLDNLDIGIRNHVKSVLSKASKDFNVNLAPQSSSQPGTYDATSGIAVKAYRAMSNLLNDIIDSYGTNNPNKTHSHYKQNKGYRPKS